MKLLRRFHRISTPRVLKTFTSQSEESEELVATTLPFFLGWHKACKIKWKLLNPDIFNELLTINPWARMGCESMAHSAFGLMGYWIRGHVGERNNCFSKIQLVGQKYRDKTTLAS